MSQLKSTFRASFKIEGVEIAAGAGNVSGYWDAYSGGKYSVPEVKYTPAEGFQQVFTGNPAVENVTVESMYTKALHGGLIGAEGVPIPSIPALSSARLGVPLPRALLGLPAEVGVIEIDPNTGIHQANRPPYTGRIMEATLPDGDSNDQATIVKVVFVISVGQIA